MKALAKRVEDRYQSAAAMRSDIERYLAGHPVHVVAPPAAGRAADHRHRRRPPSSRPCRCRSRRTTSDDRGTRPGLLIFLALLLLVRARARGVPAAEDVREPQRPGAGPRPVRHDRADRRAPRSATPGSRSGSIDHAFDNDVKAEPRDQPGPRRPTSPSTQGATVDFTVSLGTPPDQGALRDRADPKQQAATALQDAHLDPMFQPVSPTSRRARWSSTDPAANAQVPQGSPVDVSCPRVRRRCPTSSACSRRTPSRRCGTPASCRSPVAGRASDKPQGTVIQQIPGAGQPEPRARR